jgi:hypothetical protein
MPTGEMDVGSSRPNRLRDSRQHLASVHERLDTATAARRERRRRRPAARLRIDGPLAATPAQPSHVVGTHDSLDRLPDEIVEPVQGITGHGDLMPGPGGNVTRVG